MGVYIPYTRLPSAYQEVEYIENNGTAYIKTGLQIKDQYRFAGKVKCLQAVFNDNGRITGGYLGYQNGVYYRLYFGGIYSDGWGYGYLGSYGRSGIGYSTNTDYDVEFSWISGNAFIKVNGTTTSSWSTTYSTALTGECPLMAQNNTESFDVHPGLRVYSAKYYDNTDTLVRDLVPCYRKVDTVIGMYDLVNDVFYTNAGTGTFSKGADINMVELKNAYIGEYRVPGANTIAYYPLTANFNDESGNGRNLSGGGSITTIGGVSCAYLAQTARAENSSASFGTTRTISVWLNSDMANTEDGVVVWTGGDGGANTKVADISLGGGSNINGGNFYNVGQNSGVNVTKGVRYYAVIVCSGGSIYIYVNGELKANTSMTLNSGNGIYLGRRGDSVTSNGRYQGYISRVIVEDKARTAQEIADYYNQTKADYGL